MKPKPLAVSIRLTWLVDMPCHLPRYYISTVLFIYLFCCQYSVLVTRGDKKKRSIVTLRRLILFYFFPLACFGAMQHSCYSSTWLCAVRQCQSPWGATKTCSCYRVCRKWRQKLRIWRWRSNCVCPPYFYFIILIHRDQLWDLSCATWLGWRVIWFNFLKKSVLDKQLTY